MKSRYLKKVLPMAIAAAMLAIASPAAAQAEESGGDSEYTYCYAALTWAEYWESEGVDNSTNVDSSTKADKKGESDKGGYDAVTRATTNHGMHRGSYQCSTVMYAEAADGTTKTFDIAYFSADNTEITLTDGTTVTWNKAAKTVTQDGTTYTFNHYEVVGWKYVPVKVLTADLSAFKEKYTVVGNGTELAGGYSEKKLQSYSGLTANVTENTNGLKTATKQEDGSFKFSARTNDGTDSGIKDTDLKTAPSKTDVGLTVKDSDGQFGEFIRVDLTGDYADLGAKMQAVTWTYYGTDKTYSEPVQSYGTKFAADNWMHSQNGIQLGLTKSERCDLPEGSDGTGYWTITITALGYSDVTYQFEVKKENICKTDADKALDEAIEKAEALKEDAFYSTSWEAMQKTLTAAKNLVGSDSDETSQANVVNATEALNKAIDALNPVYVMMNVPYDDFYKAELGSNNVSVDAFTSATKSKTKNRNLVNGSYHVDSKGSDITGVTVPVKIAETVNLTGYTEVTDEDDLFENASYAYYVTGEVPNYYKEATLAEGKWSFGETKYTGENKATSREASDLSATLTTESNYGDYQIDFDYASFIDKIPYTKICGVLVTTTDGYGYGMRHLENIWNTSGKMKAELAWCTGFTTKAHGCTTSSAHYVSMMGKTIKSITYYTESAVYEINFVTAESGGLYVPIKTMSSSDVTVANADVASGETTVTMTKSLPDAFAAAYSVEGLENVAVANGKMTFTAVSADKAGKYTLKISDTTGVYADINSSFVLTTSKVAAAWDNDAKQLKTADGATSDDLTNYLANISKVTVDGTSYSATGKGSVKLIDSDGKLLTDATPFADGKASYSITVTATGYTNDLTFTYKTDSTTTAETTLASAKALDSSAYTADSWATVSSAIQELETLLNDSSATAEQVAAAQKKLSDAVNALVKASTETSVTVTLSKTSYTYTGKVKKPSVVVKDSEGNTIPASDYTVTYAKGCKAVGQYKVTVTYNDKTYVKTFKIVPKGTKVLSVKAAKKALTVKLKKQKKQTTGYQVQYSTSKNFKKNAKITTIKKNKTTVAKIKKLKSKKTYYVRVRTYKNVKVNGKTVKIVSKWSSAKKVKVK